MNAHSLARLADLAPQVQEKWKMADEMLRLEGIDCEITQGGRSFNLQGALRAQGREPLDQVNEKRAAVGLAAITEADNFVVTHAAPGDSWHNYYVALDAAPFDAQGQPDWDENHPTWKRMEQIGASVGFECGAGWSSTKRDAPHFQFTGSFPVSPTEEVKQLFRDGGLAAVWSAAYE